MPAAAPASQGACRVRATLRACRNVLLTTTPLVAKRVLKSSGAGRTAAVAPHAR
jgi:hypothetical protein